MALNNTLKDEQSLFKIYNPETGLYSSGGTYVKWTKNGKVWTNIGHLKNHLHLVDTRKNNPYKGCKIVVYKLIVEHMVDNYLIDGKTLEQYVE